MSPLKILRFVKILQAPSTLTPKTPKLKPETLTPKLLNPKRQPSQTRNPNPQTRKPHPQTPITKSEDRAALMSWPISGLFNQGLGRKTLNKRSVSGG